MTHDPFQNYSMLGAYSAVPNQLLPFTGQPNYGQYPVGLNPLAAQQQQQLSPFNIPGHLQGLQQNPFGGFQQQNPWAALQNPLIAAILQNPMIHPLVAQAIGAQAIQAQLGLQQQQSPYQQQGGFGTTPFGQTGTPYGQTGSPFGQSGYPLAPQSWVGQTGQLGQIHPLYQQLAARAFTPGINPWAGY